MNYVLLILLMNSLANLAFAGNKLSACARQVISEQQQLSVDEAQRRLQLLGRYVSGGPDTYLGDRVGLTLQYAAEQFGMDPIALEAELRSGIVGDNIEALRENFQQLADSFQ